MRCFARASDIKLNPQAQTPSAPNQRGYISSPRSHIQHPPSAQDSSIKKLKGKGTHIMASTFDLGSSKITSLLSSTFYSNPESYNKAYHSVSPRAGPCRRNRSQGDEPSLDRPSFMHKAQGIARLHLHPYRHNSRNLNRILPCPTREGSRSCLNP